MPKQTTNYKLGYYLSGEFTDPFTESNRWNTVDAQLRGIYEIVGNGVLTGWQISGASDSLEISISAGKGIVSFVTCESLTGTSLTVLPKRINYIYAALTPNSYWTKSVAFATYTSGGNRADHVLIGSVETDENGVIRVDLRDRINVGLYDTISRLIAQHRHVGGVDYPAPVDLEYEVRGLLGQNNIEPVDASMVATGILSDERIPQLDHNTHLSNTGHLTHAQIDSFIELISSQDDKYMGRTALVNFLQLVLALKHQWPEIDEYLVNQLAFIPGISPDTIIDQEHTTAEVDTRTSQEGGEHTISGHPGESGELFTKTFDTEEELDRAEKNNVYVDGSSINLQTTAIKSMIEDFEDVSDWITQIVDLSSGDSSFFIKDASTYIQGEYSGKVALNVDTQANVAFILEKTFLAQNWSQYDKIVFYIKSTRVDHGDVYFYLHDAVRGSQDSFNMVLRANAPTINRDTLMVGWREVVVDISRLDRTAVNRVGFYTSSQGGWDVSKEFVLNVDNMYLTRGNEFVRDGYARFIYGDEADKNFFKIRWNALEPSGVNIRVRTRLANDPDRFDDSLPNPAVWSPYSSTNGFEIYNPTQELFKYIQIEYFMVSSIDRRHAPVLKRLYLDCYVSAEESRFIFDTKEQWESGALVNADVTSESGSVLIDKTDKLGFMVYGKDRYVYEADEDFIQTLKIAGSLLPRTTQHVIKDVAPSWGQISAVQKGLGNTFWVADTDNDRVVQIDKAGKLMFGLYGSFLTDPVDVYGKEEGGPGSNDYADLPQKPSTPAYDDLQVLHSIYNPDNQILTLVFNRPLDVNYGGGKKINLSKMFLKAGSYRFYFGDDTSIILWGIVPEKHAYWYRNDDDTSDAMQHAGQFNFQSHILQLGVSQADASTISSVANFVVPSLTIVQPYQNDIIYEDSVIIHLITANIDIGGASGNGIRLMVDDSEYEFYTSHTIEISGLTEGKHTFEVVLVDGNNNPLTNLEALSRGEFIIDLSGASLHEPSMVLTSPHPGQIMSSDNAQIEFIVENYPILPVGSHIRYQVDENTPLEHRTLDPIILTNMEYGQHRVLVFLADEYGLPLGTIWSSSSIIFSIGITSLSDLRIVIDSGVIDAPIVEGEEEESGLVSNLETNIGVDIGNVHFANICSPVDVQFLSQEASSVNPYGHSSILVAKLRSPSSTTYLSAPDVQPGVGVAPPTDPNAIFGSKFMDGHSVVQFSCVDGSVLFSNNAAQFGNDRAVIKKTLGSAYKVANNRVLIGDAMRKRAIITNTDLVSQKTFVAWEYLSNRFVVDAQPVWVGEKHISVGQTMASPHELLVEQGATVIWKNDSMIPVTIYSGTTTPEQFASDPDLELFGDDFISQELLPGEGFSYTFYNLGTFNWFAYPTIVTGTVHVSSSGVSPADQYMLVENDGLESAFGNRVIKIDSWGNVIWSYGEGFLVDPKDVRGVPGGSSIIIST